jgi:hypothetical protein
MRVHIWASAILFIPFPLATAVVAQAPVAVVEEVGSRTTGLEFMDYLITGRTIRLAADERLVVGYLKSCWRETIVGGIVTIGAEQSVVQDGRVQRSRVLCDTGESTTSKETAVSGAMVFRNAKQQLPKQTVYSLSPIFALKGTDATLSIERLDKPDGTISVNTAASPRGDFVDLSQRSILLAAGGSYRARHGRNTVVFKIDASASSEAMSIVGRLVDLRPSS